VFYFIAAYNWFVYVRNGREHPELEIEAWKMRRKGEFLWRKLHWDYDVVLGALRLVYFWTVRCNLNFG